MSEELDLDGLERLARAAMAIDAPMHVYADYDQASAPETVLRLIQMVRAGRSEAGPKDAAGLVERLTSAAESCDMAASVAQDRIRSETYDMLRNLLNEAAQALTALAGRVEEVERALKASQLFRNPGEDPVAYQALFAQAFVATEMDLLKEKSAAAESQVQALIAGQREMVEALLPFADALTKAEAGGWYALKRDLCKRIARDHFVAAQSALSKASAPMEGESSAVSQSQPVLASKRAIGEGGDTGGEG